MYRLIIVPSLIAFFLLPALPSVAQQLIARMQTGYTFESRFNIDGGRARFNDGAIWVGSMAYFFDDQKGAEIYYNYQNTLLRARSVLIQGENLKSK